MLALYHRRLLAGLLAFLLSHAGGARAAVYPRIVNGLDTHDFPTTGALLAARGGGPITADNAFTYCSGTLIGCRTFLTAAHCVASDADPTHYWVYLQNAGTLPVAAVVANPAYTGLGGNDVAIVTLASDVTGIAPTPLNATHDLTALTGLSGTIVGFGLTVVPGRNFGIKRSGAVQTANCVSAPGGEGTDKLVCWDFVIPVGPPGTDSDTCNGDSGGPLFLDFGTGSEVAGVTSAGSQPFCRPLDHSWDASVYFNAAWIQSELGADATTTCGGIGPVGGATATTVGYDGTLVLGHLSDAFVTDVPAGTAVLRFALNGDDNATFDPNLYVKHGPGAGPTSYDCKADGASVYGGCEIVNPAPGAWSILVTDAAGAATACADDGDPCTIDQCDGTSAVCRHASGPDTDGDGLCDAVDACTNPGHGQDFAADRHPKLTFAKIGTDPISGDDTLTIAATFSLASGAAFAALDPSSRGARILVQNAAGGTRVDVSLADGAYAGNGTRGWKSNGARTTWTYKDATGAPANGIVGMQIKDASKHLPRGVSVTVTGKKGLYPFVAGDEPPHVVVVLGDHADAVTGACGESAFVAADCAFNGKGTTLTCKQ